MFECWKVLQLNQRSNNQMLKLNLTLRLAAILGESFKKQKNTRLF